MNCTRSGSTPALQSKPTLIAFQSDWSLHRRSKGVGIGQYSKAMQSRPVGHVCRLDVP